MRAAAYVGVHLELIKAHSGIANMFATGLDDPGAGCGDEGLL